MRKVPHKPRTAILILHSCSCAADSATNTHKIPARLTCVCAPTTRIKHSPFPALACTLWPRPEHTESPRSPHSLALGSKGREGRGRSVYFLDLCCMFVLAGPCFFRQIALADNLFRCSESNLLSDIDHFIFTFKPRGGKSFQYLRISEIPKVCCFWSHTSKKPLCLVLLNWTLLRTLYVCYWKPYWYNSGGTYCI